MNAIDLLDIQPQQFSTQHSALSTTLSVVVPLLNEAESLLLLHAEINAALGARVRRRRAGAMTGAVRGLAAKARRGVASGPLGRANRRNASSASRVRRRLRRRK